MPYRGTGWSILVLIDSLEVLDEGRRKVLWVIEVLPFVELNSGALAREARAAEHHG